MDLTEELIKFVAMEVNGTTVTEFNGNTIDLGKWASGTYVVKSPVTDAEELIADSPPEGMDEES